MEVIKADHQKDVEFWNTINKALDEHPLAFTWDMIKNGAGYVFTGNEMGQDMAEFIEHYSLYTSKYLSDLEKGYEESFGKNTSGDYEHKFADDKTLTQLLETIYGAGASNVVYKEESEKKLTLMIAALGSKQVLDAAASAGLKKSEIKALEKAIKEQEAIAKNKAPIQGLEVSPHYSENEFVARIPGNDRAYVQFQGKSDGLYVAAVYKGDLAGGEGGHLLAESIKASGLQMQGNKMVIENILNLPTMNAYKNGLDASKSVLGNTGINALRELGITPKKVYYQPAGGKLNLVFEY